MKFAVIGAGSWGTAVACVLAKREHDVCIFSRRKDAAERMLATHENTEYLPGIFIPENVSFDYDLTRTLAGADVIIMAVPSHAVRETARKIGDISKSPVILNIAKGIEQKTLLRMSEVVLEEIPSSRFVAMSGPSHAEEVAVGMPTTNLVVSTDEELACSIQKAVMTPEFRLYTTTDLAGVELGGAFKNVIALCAGICDGLGFGDNTKAALMTRGIAEISRLGVAMGAKRETFSGLSGIGDLIVTCTSMHSRNRRAGILIGQGYTPEQAMNEVKMVVEGVRTADAAYNLSLKYNVDMPICRQAYEVLFNNKPARDAVYELMLRSEKPE